MTPDASPTGEASPSGGWAAGGWTAGGWTAAHVAALVAGFALATIVRILLLPTPGLTGDIDEFVLWAHRIAVGPLGAAYQDDITFPPVMVYVWALVGLVEPAVRVVTDSADPVVRAVMKTPASLADFGLAAGVAWALRDRPGWAVVGALGIALHPAVIDVSAWWGQYESIYVLGGLVAFLLVVSGRPGWGAVALAIALMSKPQAAPFVVPFAAWYLGRFGWRGALRYGLVALAAAAVLWLPFVPFGGPLDYAGNLAEYQGQRFAVLSLRAWNPWWLVETILGAPGTFIADTSAIAGPVTFRLIGYAAAALLELVVFLAVLRAPTARGLALGLACATLVAFVGLTTMHERYAYAALVFLALLVPDRRVLVLWFVFGVAFTLNLLAAVPPTPEIGAALPVDGWLGVAGSVAITAVAGSVVWLLLRESPRPRAELEPGMTPALGDGGGALATDRAT